MTFGAVANPVLLSGDMHAVTTPVQKELGDSMMRMHDDMAKHYLSKMRILHLLKV